MRLNDGRWAVRMVTDAGVCDKSHNYVIAVKNGGVRYIPEDSDPAPTVSGHVPPSGAVNLDIRKGIARVAASGSSTVRRVRAAGSSASSAPALDGAEARPVQASALKGATFLEAGLELGRGVASSSPVRRGTADMKRTFFAAAVFAAAFVSGAAQAQSKKFDGTGASR